MGGKDFYAGGGQVNRARQGAPPGGGSGRQPGSSFKPFMLAKARRRTYSGRSPVVIADHPFQNYGGEQFGTMTLKEALKHSVNTVFVQLIHDVGVEKTMQLAKALGLTSIPDFDTSKYGVQRASARSTHHRIEALAAGVRGVGEPRRAGRADADPRDPGQQRRGARVEP